MAPWMKLLGLLAFLLAPAAALAVPAPERMSGEWVWEVGGADFLLVKLESGKDGRVSCWVMRPERFSLDRDLSVSDVHMPAIVQPLEDVHFEGDGLHAATRTRSGAAGNPGKRTEWLLSLTDADMLAMAPAGVPGIKPIPLRRSPGKVTIAGDWDPAKVYVGTADLPSNPALTQIFEADQAARAIGTKIDWAAVAPKDAERRVRVREMLDGGQIRSGEDYLHAAFIFQHGDEPEDYLLAHALAMVAIARGRPDATWIAAATLDRYLLKIGRKQLYGTQFETLPGGALGDRPCDCALLPDTVREASGVDRTAEKALLGAPAAETSKAGRK